MMGSVMGGVAWRMRMCSISQLRTELARFACCGLSRKLSHLYPLSQFALVDLLFDPLAVARHRKTEDEINHCNEQVALELEGLPVGVGVERHVHCAGELVQAHDAD